MNKLIIFLLRKKLGLKKNQRFRFLNQANPYDEYIFTDDCLVKCARVYARESHIGLNFLLSEDAQELIVRL